MRVKLFLLLAVILGLAILADAQTATFVKIDSTTGANYKGVYGSSGSVGALVSSNPPSTATYTVVGNSTWTWASGVYGGTCWYSAPSFSISLNVTGTQQIALYAIDYDKQGRSETFQVLNGSTVLDIRTISSFTAGVYVVWDISGAVTIKITANSGPNAVVSAIFFDPGPGSTPPSVTLTWTPSTTAGVTEYLILRASSSTATPVLIGSVSATVATFTDTTVVAGQSYVYTVLAVIAQSVPSNQASAAVP